MLLLIIFSLIDLYLLLGIIVALWGHFSLRIENSNEIMYYVFTIVYWPKCLYWRYKSDKS